jgi:hypothetical protein
MMGSTSNALSKGGHNYKDMFEDSVVTTETLMVKLKVDCMVYLFLWNGIWKAL